MEPLQLYFTHPIEWSNSNKQRVIELIEQGHMTEIGLNKIGNYQKTGKLV